jgi:hypothetical protein
LCARPHGRARGFCAIPVPKVHAFKYDALLACRPTRVRACRQAETAHTDS